MCESSAAIVARAPLSSASPGGPARLVLDLGDAHPRAVALARSLAAGVGRQLETLLADPATDLPAELRAAVAALADALADALAEQTAQRATVTVLDTPLARAWRDHPAGWGRGAMPR